MKKAISIALMCVSMLIVWATRCNADEAEVIPQEEEYTCDVAQAVLRIQSEEIFDDPKACKQKYNELPEAYLPYVVNCIETPTSGLRGNTTMILNRLEGQINNLRDCTEAEIDENLAHYKAAKEAREARKARKARKAEEAKEAKVEIVDEYGDPIKQEAVEEDNPIVQEAVVDEAEEVLNAIAWDI